MPLLEKNGKLWIRGGKLLTPEADCCCLPIIECGCGNLQLPCCSTEAYFDLVAIGDPGLFCDGPGNPPQLRASWSWVGCFFSWSLGVVGLEGDENYYLDGRFNYPFGSGANVGLGVWVMGTFGNDHEFNGSPDVISRRCIQDDATVTISRTQDGYSFTVAGVIADPDVANCTGYCDQLNGTWVVEC